MERIRKTIEKGIEGTNFFIDNKNPDPFGTSFCICNKRSKNVLSVAYYRGECSALHIKVSEFPSIHPKMGGNHMKKESFIEAKSAEEILEWLNTEKFYEPCEVWNPFE